MKGWTVALTSDELIGGVNLPDDLCQTVLHHHDPPLTLTGLDFAVAMSDLLATSLWTPDSASVITAQRLLQETFAVDVDGFITFATDVQQTIHENAAVYSVNIQGTIDCERLLETAKRKYEDVAMENGVCVEETSLPCG